MSDFELDFNDYKKCIEIKDIELKGDKYRNYACNLMKNKQNVSFILKNIKGINSLNISECDLFYNDELEKAIKLELNKMNIKYKYDNKFIIKTINNKILLNINNINEYYDDYNIIDDNKKYKLIKDIWINYDFLSIVNEDDNLIYYIKMNYNNIYTLLLNQDYTFDFYIDLICDNNYDDNYDDYILELKLLLRKIKVYKKNNDKMNKMNIIKNKIITFKKENKELIEKNNELIKENKELIKENNKLKKEIDELKNKKSNNEIIDNIISLLN